MLEIDMNKNLGGKKKREDSSFPTASFFVSFFGKALMGSCTSCTHRSLDGWPDEARMTAQQRMASTLPVRTHRHTGHAMAASASPAAKHSPHRERCLQGRSTTEAGLRRQPRHARSTTARCGGGPRTLTARTPRSPRRPLRRAPRPTHAPRPAPTAPSPATPPPHHGGGRAAPPARRRAAPSAPLPPPSPEAGAQRTGLP